MSPGGLTFPASSEQWLPLGVALLARDRCLPSAWEEGGGVTAAAGGPPVRAAGGPAGPGRLRLPAPRGLPALLGREFPGTFHTRPSLSLQVRGSERDAAPPPPAPPTRAVTAF